MTITGGMLPPVQQETNALIRELHAQPDGEHLALAAQPAAREPKLKPAIADRKTTVPLPVLHPPEHVAR